MIQSGITTAALGMIDWMRAEQPGLYKTGEVLKELCRESKEAAYAVWEGIHEGKTLTEAKAAVMEYVKEHDGTCTREDALRVLRELYGTEHEGRQEE